MRPLQLVVFDVDGTLYDQRRLRRRMVCELLTYCATRSDGLTVLRTIRCFRNCREKLAHEDVDGLLTAQYELVARTLGMREGDVRLFIKSWIHERPLPHLARCRFSGVSELFKSLKQFGIIVGVLSDYSADAKLAALGLRPDIQVSSEEPEINRLKPNPKGLLHLLNIARVPAGNALFVGNREEIDGECARRANVPFLLKVASPSGRRHHMNSYGDFPLSVQRLGFQWHLPTS